MDSGADQASDDGPGDAPVGVIEDPAGRWRVTLGARALDAGALGASVVLPSCGAVVTFTGTTRDHAPDPAGGLRTGIGRLDYEAYETEALARMAKVAATTCDRWPTVGRVEIAHRLGPVGLGEASVVVAVSAAHRDGAFEAARFAIDTVKATVPIWKREEWDGGSDWAGGAVAVTSLPAAPGQGDVIASATDPAFAAGASMSDTGAHQRASGDPVQ